MSYITVAIDFSFIFWPKMFDYNSNDYFNYMIIDKYECYARTQHKSQMLECKQSY